MSDAFEESTLPATNEADAGPTLLAPLNENASDEVDDSLYAGSITGRESLSLTRNITKYCKELGRTFHSFGLTEHWGPNDEKAQDQQDFSHKVWTLALKDKFFLAPVRGPQTILDLGTGTGE